MTALEIVNAFLKGNTFAQISEKQRNWLFSQCLRENITREHGGDIIPFDGFHIRIKSVYHVRGAYGGGLGKTLVPGVYNITKMFTIRFTDTGNTEVLTQHELERYTKNGYAFEVINFQS